MVRQVTLGLFPSDGPLGNNRLPLRILFPKLDPVPKFHRQKFYGHCNRRSGRLSPFSSAPRLREVPQKIPNLIFLSGDFHVHQSLQGPFLVVFVPLCRWPPVRRVIPSLPGAVRRSEGPAFRCCSGGSSDPPARWPRAPCVFPSAAIADSGLVGRDLLFAV